MSLIKRFRESLGLLATRRFGSFWFASLLSSIGTWAQQVAEPWLLLNLGASSFLIGLDSFAMNAPVLLLTLVGGALADRSDRRRVITVFQSIQMLCPTAIVILLLAHRVQPWMIVGLSVVVGITDALSMPSFQSIVPSIVPREQIASGLALNSTQFNLSRILGPAIAASSPASARWRASWSARRRMCPSSGSRFGFCRAGPRHTRRLGSDRAGSVVLGNSALVDVGRRFDDDQQHRGELAPASTASPQLLGQTVGLYMLAMRGGISLGALLTGAVAGLLGVRHALLLDGLAALAVQSAVARMWFRETA